MADKLADLSPEERAQRVAEMKAKMQSAAKKTKAETAEGESAAAAAAPAPAAVKAPAAPAPVAAEKVAAVAVPVQEEAKVTTNGHAGNGAAASAEVAGAATVVYSAPVIAEESPEEKARKEMNRREFLTYAWGAALGLLVLESGVATFFFMYPRFRAGEFGGVFYVGPESSLPASDAVPVPYTDGKFWLVTTEAQEPRALYMVCTHLGCLYKWAPSNFRFECPCHGSKFSHDGYYIEGPAPRSLDMFEITVENGEVAVNTGRRIIGEPAADSPARVVAT
jgi:cytochrome b6-f complex iron-sulfur subunit